MASKKTKKPSSTDETNLKSMAGKIMESGQQIWLAGLGAFSKAQEEGGKLYDSLVKEGSALEKVTSKYTTAKVSEVRGAVETTVNQVKDRATDTFGKLEKVFEDRVSGALGALGIPGREELNDLSRKVEELNRLVKGIGGAKGAPAKAAVKPAVKAAAKPAAKAAAKPAVKAAAKPVAKAAVKPAVKVTAKPAVKAAAKPASGLQKVQAQAQKIAKNVETQAKVAVKSASKTAKATLDKASLAAKEAVKTVTDAVADSTK